jgi:simple sugar transport system permease protein
MMAWRGVVLIITGGFMQNFLPSPLFHFIFAGELGSMVQMQFVWAVVIGVLFWIILENHKFGNAIFATGGNPKAAVEIGINPAVVKFVCFVVLGLLVAFCSSLGMTRINSIAPLQGQGLEMVAVAAVVIGGTNLRGGEGDILGTCLGAITIYTIQDALMLLRAPGFYFQLFVGVFIILAVVAKGLVRAR